MVCVPLEIQGKELGFCSGFGVYRSTVLTANGSLSPLGLFPADILEAVACL